MLPALSLCYRLQFVQRRERDAFSAVVDAVVNRCCDVIASLHVRVLLETVEGSACALLLCSLCTHAGETAVALFPSLFSRLDVLTGSYIVCIAIVLLVRQLFPCR